MCSKLCGSQFLVSNVLGGAKWCFDLSVEIVSNVLGGAKWCFDLSVEIVSNVLGGAKWCFDLSVEVIKLFYMTVFGVKYM